MESYKIKHMHFTDILLPLQYRNKTEQHTVPFLIDTGASRTTIPISLLLDSEILEAGRESILNKLKDVSVEVVNGEGMKCYVATLRNVTVFGRTIKTFRFLVTESMNTKYAILGNDFIDASSVYHTAGCNWDFRSFDVHRYEDIWAGLNAPENVNSFTDLLGSLLDSDGLVSISDF